MSTVSGSPFFNSSQSIFIIDKIPFTISIGENFLSLFVMSRAKFDLLLVRPMNKEKFVVKFSINSFFFYI